jgi:ATP-dependent DNA helicase DinG
VTTRSEPLREQVEAVFGPDGQLARVLPGFEPRRSQVDMARGVAETFADGGLRLVEAGTGTGKTLAYLVPAILSGVRTLVSTGTKNLQEQIVDKDLPLLERTLGRPFTATVMKGRANYLCLHRFDQLRAGGLPRQAALSDLGAFGTEIDDRILVPILERWAAATETGDRAELTDLPEDLQIWRDVSASAENCLGSSCPRFHDCYVTRMRQRATESDLVVVNHHLLFADAAVRQSAYGEVIPACEQAVLDEAHQLEDIATQYFGLAVSNYRLDDFTRDAARVAEGWPLPDGRDAIRRAISRVDERASRFFSHLAPGQRGDRRARVTADALGDVSDQGSGLIAALEHLEASLQLLKSLPSDEAAAVSIGQLDDVDALAARAAALRSELGILLRADDPDYVFFLEIRGRGIFLRAAPIDVSGIVRDQVLGHYRAGVLTSATLTVDGHFDYVSRRLGVRHAVTETMPSEFDFAHQAVLYLPRQMPPPRSPAFPAAVARETVEIVRRTKGRAFVLFTSYAVLRAVEPVVRERVDYPLFVQGAAPRSALLRGFRETPHAVLLATSSFWQGVDVVGDALSCVIVDKLPFASPLDPITAARMESIAANGGDAFDEYQVPQAILTLLQGLGRLIRHRGDRGVLAVLDPRLRTMGYGRRFLASMPAAPVTHDLDAVGRFLPD